MRLFTRRAREREQRDELLSAYLDGELNAEERMRLEAQLATDPTLQAELEALRCTVTLVRALPTIPIPRNFILPRTLVARPRPAPTTRPRRAWATPLLTAATAVVSLLFVVVLAGDLLLSGTGRLVSAPATERLMVAEAPQEAPAPGLDTEEVAVEVQVEAEKALSAATPLPMPVEATPQAMPTATVEAEHYAVVPSEGKEPPALAPTASPPGAERADEAPTMPATGGPGEEATAPAPTAIPSVAEDANKAPTTPATATAALEMYAGGAEPTSGEETEAALLWAGEEDAGAAEGVRGAPESEVAELAATSPWRMMEIILGLAALGLALVTVWTWRIRRR